MAGPLPHTSQVDQWADDYLSDAESRFKQSIAKVRKTSAFREIYWSSLAADGIFEKLSTPQWKPQSRAGRSVILRIPLLAAAGQVSVAKVELRRLVELTFWTIYFSEHPVEWSSFKASPSDGFFPNIDKPIRYCAHRGLKFYLDYAAERFEQEPSGLAIEAVKQIRAAGDQMNAIVHPAQLSVTPGRIPPFEDVSESALRAFCKIQKSVCSNVCIALAAMFTQKFNKLPPMYRANFDRLIGSTTAKQLRSGAFGLA